MGGGWLSAAGASLAASAAGVSALQRGRDESEGEGPPLGGNQSDKHHLPRYSLPWKPLHHRQPLAPHPHRPLPPFRHRRGQPRSPPAGPRGPPRPPLGQRPEPSRSHSPLTCCLFPQGQGRWVWGQFRSTHTNVETTLAGSAAASGVGPTAPTHTATRNLKPGHAFNLGLLLVSMEEMVNMKRGIKGGLAARRFARLAQGQPHTLHSLSCHRIQGDAESSPKR